MARLLSTQHEIVSVSPPSGGRGRSSLGWRGLGAIACGRAGALVRYGSTVFFEMITSGISACF